MIQSNLLSNSELVNLDNLSRLYRVLRSILSEFRDDAVDAVIEDAPLSLSCACVDVDGAPLLLLDEVVNDALLIVSPKLPNELRGCIILILSNEVNPGEDNARNRLVDEWQ